MERVLCFGAHPDDLEAWMGGALRLLSLSGHALGAVVLTEGLAGTRQPREGRRRRESEAALGSLGLVPLFLGLPDGGLASCGELGPRLEAELRSFRPTRVFGPHPQEAHADHAALGACLAGLAPGLGFTLCFYLETRASPTHLLDLGRDYGPKAELIRCHASQLPGPGEPRDHLPGGRDILERAGERDRRYGIQAGCTFAEPYLRLGGGGGPVLVSRVADLWSGGESRQT